MALYVPSGYLPSGCSTIALSARHLEIAMKLVLVVVMAQSKVKNTWLDLSGNKQSHTGWGPPVMFVGL